MVPTVIKQDRLNGYRLATQGLTPRFDDVAEALRAAGWAPSRESAYLAMEARVAGFTREQLDELVFDRGEFLELAILRGQSCIVPRELATVLVRLESPGQRETAERVLDEGSVPLTGRVTLMERVVGAVRERPRSSQELLTVMQEGHGAAARYLSMPSILNAVTTLLRLEGLIVLTKLEPPLDQGPSVFELTERALPGENLDALSAAEALKMLCAWYFRVHGPATKADFGWFSGAGAAEVDAAFAAVKDNLVEIRLEDLAFRYFMPSSKYEELRVFERTGADPVIFVPFRDPWLASHEARVGRFFRREEMGKLPPGPPIPAILHGGYVVGRWEIDRESGKIRHEWFRSPGEGVDERAVRRGLEIEAFLSTGA